MIVKKYLSKVVALSQCTETIFSVEFTTDSGRYRFHPGQFLHLALDKYDGIGQWPESRCFSMESSPDESTLRIVFSVKGNFTKRMSEELQVDKEVWLKMPYGDLFIQQHNKTNTIFIAGGTGITPFLSLFSHESFNTYTNPNLYFGIKNTKFDIYDNALQKASVINPQIKIIKQYEDSRGLLDINSIYNNHKDDSCYFISGPPAMIKSFKEKLKSLGVSGQNIKTDDWE